MKRLISLISAMTLLAAVPMSASATDIIYVSSEFGKTVVNKILEDLSPYDFNADGVTDFNDVQLILHVYALTGTNSIDVNDDRTYIVNSDKAFEDITEEEFVSVLATGNVTNPEWDPEIKYGSGSDAFMDKVNSIDASFLLTAIAEYYGAGDVNADGAIDSLDASNVLVYYSHYQASDDPSYYGTAPCIGAGASGDYNGDGAINALDASEIMADYAAAQTA